ncbi:MAG: ABC transporter ATP-binding protein [Clostridia bacterium]|nr:ABC transporter ATP-binding protein [Clostridia bacterium]
MKNVIEIKNLCKSFGSVKAVQDISFSVGEGELFAFLGINGAGKSTTINIMCSCLSKDSGSVIIDGDNTDISPDRAKKKLGVVFQSSTLDGSLSVLDNLRFRAALYGITGNEFRSRLDEIVSLLDLSEILKRQVSRLSGGQRRKADIARALFHRPRILILDEPTTGLDPQTRKLIWSVIYKLRETEGMTVFLTTHYMEEAAEADRVVILDSGRITAEGTPLELKNKYTGDFISLYGISEEDACSLGLPFEPIKDGYRISVSDTAEATRLIISHPELFSDYEITKGKMDDVFLAATGKRLTGGDKK